MLWNYDFFLYNYLLPPTPTPNKKTIQPNIHTYQTTMANATTQKILNSNVIKEVKVAGRESVSNSDVGDPLPAGY